MSPTNRIAAANQSFRDLSDKIEHILGQACRLQLANPKNLSLATTMGQAITEVVMTHGTWVTVLSPLILSAAAKLQEHVDGNNTGISTPPVWMQILGDDRRIQGQPLFPTTIHYQGESWSLSPQAGPSQPRHNSGVEELSAANVPGVQKQRGKSRAIITTDDELDEDEVAPPPNKPTVADPLARKSSRYVEVTSEEEMDADEEPAIQVALKMNVKTIANVSGTVLTEDEFADTSAPTWAPHCSQCVARDLICHQGFNKNNGRTLKVCALCSHLKIHCGGKGSNAPPAKGKSSAARRAHSQSRQLPFADASLEDPAPEAGLLVEEEPAGPATTGTILRPAGPSSILPPSCVAHEQEMQELKVEVAMLHMTVEALMVQVVAGNQQLQAAYMRLNAQDIRTDLLTGQITHIHHLIDPLSLVPPTDLAGDGSDDLAAGPANDIEDSACLPVAIKTPEAEESHASGEPEI
ncbi:uncharacterized protein F5147DRAFT_651521 [Suillus discolor]|uniref:Uncharacterized protein n=1 Tax=Suillus discolor TaxID=1912936 RepID=A0A9P7FBC6_9AGAM|nr:uncharacterized protein F5147DRAFT_651521 [Suillus discolor]KAG2111346.1 hypothetical protein F5147DRAFT_651521 [Suillus discolor]